MSVAYSDVATVHHKTIIEIVSGALLCAIGNINGVSERRERTSTVVSHFSLESLISINAHILRSDHLKFNAIGCHVFGHYKLCIDRAVLEIVETVRATVLENERVVFSTCAFSIGITPDKRKAEDCHKHQRTYTKHTPQRVSCNFLHNVDF